jgi:pfkB family carbohydrate kinase
VILVVCLNPALDITHHVPVVDWAGVNRPREVATRPGGKGVNVARTLLTLGAEVLVIGLAGGATGQALTAGLPARTDSHRRGDPAHLRRPGRGAPDGGHVQRGRPAGPGGRVRRVPYFF